MSATTRSRLVQLQSHTGLLASFIGDERVWLDLLGNVRHAAEPAAALELFPLIFSSNGRFARAAAAVVIDLVRLTPVEELPWLDETARRHWPYTPVNLVGWPEIQPLDVARLARLSEDAVWLFGIASFSGDGYLRQAAVEHLTRFTTGEELRFLLLRLNDWVENVRAAARSGVEARLSPEFAPAFAAALPLVLRLTHATRSDHRNLVSRIEDLLEGMRGRDAILAVLGRARPAVRRYCYRLLAGAAPADLPDLLARALQDEDVIVRRWAIESISNVTDAQIRRRLLDTALLDPVGRIRRQAFCAFAVAFPYESQQRAIGALLDRAAVVRNEARAWLVSEAQLDAAQFYREQIEETALPALRRVVEGLGEAGIPDDAGRLLPFLKHENAGLRRAAVRAIGRLAGESFTEPLTAALLDPAPGVAREASEVLAEHVYLVPVQRLWDEMKAAHPVSVRRSILSLLARLSKWDCIFYLVETAADPDPEIAETARQRIDRWVARFNGSFVSPSRDQIERLKAALRRNRFALDRDTLRELSFALQAFDR